MPDITYIYTNKDNAEFNNLCALLNRELETAVAGKVNPIKSRASKTEDFTDVILALSGGKAVGCIALRPFSCGVAEIKRMYVAKEQRKCGIATALLQKCIALARDNGFTATVLETNERLPNAKRLYLKAGFEKTASYGPYADLPDTLCMKKEII